jgi:superfamily I DNA/RNA helicase
MRVWSDYQKAIFENVASGKGHTFVKALAGTGKTTTLEECFNRILPHEKAIAFAFNTDIAKELTNRIKAKNLKFVEAKTLHSFGLSMYRMVYNKVQIDKNKVMNLLYSRMGDEPESNEIRMTIAKIVSLAKGQLSSTVDEIDEIIYRYGIEISPKDEPLYPVKKSANALPTAEEALREYVITMVLAILDDCKKTPNVIDFDDMIWMPVVLNLSIKKHDRVFIDETQDLNKAQIELAIRSVKPNGRVLAVGDPHQAIYGFRGADFNAVPMIIEKLNATILPLSVTYRCAKSIVKEAQRFVPELEAASSSEEGQVAVIKFEEIFSKIKEGDFLISRTNAPLINLCLRFLKDGRRANILGRDIGASLAVLVKKMKAKSVVELTDRIEGWAIKEINSLLARKPPRDVLPVEDKRDCILALCEGADSVKEVLNRIEKLFSDTDESKIITLTSTHRSKGLERNNVFLIKNTYMKPRKNSTAAQIQEEKNLYYVGVTRAKKNLYLFDFPNKKQNSN